MRNNTNLFYARSHFPMYIAEEREDFFRREKNIGIKDFFSIPFRRQVFFPRTEI